jgi:hypothetical protein
METTPPFGAPDNPPALSLGARLMNIFVAPGDVFDDLALRPFSASNWIVPVLLSCVVAMTYVFVSFSQPSIQQEIQAQQNRQFEKMVAQGKMRAEDADRAKEAMAGMGLRIAKIGGSVAAVLVSLAWPFVLALGLLLVAKIGLRSGVSYLKLVEVVGLSGMIGALGGVVATLLAVIKGSLLATLGPALLIENLDPLNLRHQMAAAINLMTFWYLGVVGIGLARLTSRSFAAAAAWVFGFWLLFRAAGLWISHFFSRM